jgi:hypothetical protein
MTEGLAGLKAAGTGPARLRRELGAAAAPALDLMARANAIATVAARLPAGLGQDAMLQLFSSTLQAALAVSAAPAPPTSSRTRGRAAADPAGAKPERAPESALGRVMRRASDLAMAVGEATTRVAGVEAPLPARGAGLPPGAMITGLGPEVGRILDELGRDSARGRPAAPAQQPGPAPSTGVGLLVTRLADALKAGTSAAVAAPSRSPAPALRPQAGPDGDRARPSPAQPPVLGQARLGFPAAGPLGARRAAIDAWLRPPGVDSRIDGADHTPGEGAPAFAVRRPLDSVLPGVELSEQIADILREQASRQGIDLT